MRSLPRIYADFNKLDAQKRVILTCKGTFDDLKNLGITLENGMEVTLYMPDDLDEFNNLDSLEVDAIIEFDKLNDFWVGRFIWDDLDYRSIKNRKKMH